MLFWRYGHTPVGTDLKQRFHSGEYAGIGLEGQDRAETRESASFDGKLIEVGQTKQVQTVETGFNRYGMIETIGEGGTGQRQRAVQSEHCHAPEAVFNLPLE